MDNDAFCRTLLEEAKRFLELSSDCEDAVGQEAHRHAAILLSFSALEAYVNSISDDMLAGTTLSVHERGLLAEKDVRLEDGEFKLTENLRMVRLEDRIRFLHHKYSGQKVDVNSSWWSQLKSAMNTRNRLSHPKEATTITQSEVERATTSVIHALSAVFKAVYKKDFPPASRGLQSTLEFR